MSGETRRKTKIVGTETYINQGTGELEEMQVIRIEERDANFHKIWLWHISDALELIGNQKTKVMLYLLHNINKENMYVGSQREIAENTGISYQTVSLTLRALMKSDFLSMKQDGVYLVNPDAIFKGGKSDRMNVLIQYQNIKTGKKVEEEEIPKQKEIEIKPLNPKILEAARKFKESVGFWPINAPEEKIELEAVPSEDFPDEEQLKLKEAIEEHAERRRQKNAREKRADFGKSIF